MKKQVKDFIRIAIFLGVALVLYGILADEGFMRTALQALVNWVCESFSLTAPTLF